jgi:nitric oxide reductase large subunit
VHEAQATGKLPPATTRTLHRQPLAAAVWLAFGAVALAYAGTPEEKHYALACGVACPALSIALMTFLGAELGPGRVVLPVSTALGCALYR